MTDRRIGYLVSQYPAPSHTFIRREVEGLRARGLVIATYSVQPPPAGLDSELDQAAMRDTFVLLRRSPIEYAKAHFTGVAKHPSRYFRTLANAWRHRVPGTRAALWALFHFAEAILLARRLERDRITHLHNHFANSGATVGFLASGFADLPWSLTLHGISEFDYPAGLLLAEKIGTARFVACVSRFGMAQAMRLTDPLQWPKLRLVRCAIDPASLPAGAVPSPSDTLRMIAVGRLSPEKGHAGLIQAMAALRTRGVDVGLTLVGDGPAETRLRAQVTAAGLQDAVTFTGRLDERAALREIARHDALVLPSFMEGLPVVLIEAMALGVPVIASRVAGIPELVRDGETGLLFDPADWDGLADAIRRLAGDVALRVRLVAAGRLRVAEEFVVDRAVLPLATLFEDERS